MRQKLDETAEVLINRKQPGRTEQGVYHHVSKLISILAEDYNNNVDVSVKLPTEAFNHFKSQTGYAVEEFLEAYRAEKAREYMQTHNKYTSSQVAKESGFTNTAQLDKALKKHLGRSFKQLRKELGDISDIVFEMSMIGQN